MRNLFRNILIASVILSLNAVPVAMYAMPEPAPRRKRQRNARKSKKKQRLHVKNRKLLMQRNAKPLRKKPLQQKPMKRNAKLLPRMQLKCRLNAIKRLKNALK